MFGDSFILKKKFKKGKKVWENKKAQKRGIKENKVKIATLNVLCAENMDIKWTGA